MNMVKFEHLKKIAEILVEMKYADDWIDDAGELLLYWIDDVYESVDILSGTLAARRQLDVVEDYLCRSHFYDLWDKTLLHNYRETTPHQRRIDKIVWCIEQFVKNDEMALVDCDSPQEVHDYAQKLEYALEEAKKVSAPCSDANCLVGSYCSGLGDDTFLVYKKDVLAKSENFYAFKYCPICGHKINLAPEELRQ